MAHVHMPASAAQQFRPGMGVEGSFAVAEAQVPLAVRTKAIQRFRDFEVVFAKVGNTYEVRMLTIGRRTPEWTEVLGGLEPGTRSEEHTSELQSLMRNSYAVFCLKKKKIKQ